LRFLLLLNLFDPFGFDLACTLDLLFLIATLGRNPFSRKPLLLLPFGFNVAHPRDVLKLVLETLDATLTILSQFGPSLVQTQVGLPHSRIRLAIGIGEMPGCSAFCDRQLAFLLLNRFTSVSDPPISLLN
jgi:hypothetical protein